MTGTMAEPPLRASFTSKGADDVDAVADYMAVLYGRGGIEGYDLRRSDDDQAIYNVSFEGHLMQLTFEHTAELPKYGGNDQFVMTVIEAFSNALPNKPKKKVVLKQSVEDGRLIRRVE